MRVVLFWYVSKTSPSPASMYTAVYSYMCHVFLGGLGCCPLLYVPTSCVLRHPVSYISYFGGMYRKNKGVPDLELATYRHAHQKQACTLLYTCVACFLFFFGWDVALYPTLKQTSVLGCIKNSTISSKRVYCCISIPTGGTTSMGV